MSALVSDPDAENCCINVMYCYNCHMYLTTAVTGSCGHQRCHYCDQIKPSCPCGNDLGYVEKDYLVTSLLEQRNAIENTLWTMLQAFLMPSPISDADENPETDYKQWIATVGNITRLTNNQAVDLIFHNRYRSFLNPYLDWLKANPQELLNLLYTVYKHRCQLWAKAGLLDCTICSELFIRPVTTPCGHTFCRECLERVLDYVYRCPTCKLDLDEFNIDAVHDNIFLSTAIQLSGSLITSTEQHLTHNDMMYALECDPKSPSTPSCFMTIKSTQKFLFRQCSRTVHRLFAIISAKTQYSRGTLMMMTDMVKYPDGNLIVTAYGLVRIVVQKVNKVDGCIVINFRPWIDVVVSPSCPDLVMTEALSRVWFRSLHPDDQSTAVTLFGPMYSDMPELDGPQWLWWVANVLPLCEDLREKYLILNIRERCQMITCALAAWNDFPGPKRFADIARRQLRLTVKQDDNVLFQ